MGMGRWGDISFSLKNISSFLISLCEVSAVTNSFRAELVR